MDQFQVELVDRSVPRYSPFELGHQACRAFGWQTVEEFRALFLDRRMRVISTAFFTELRGDSVAVPVREILEHAADVDATYVIFAHNHPSGDPTPSPDDIRMTRLLRYDFEHFGFTILDHFVVAKSRWVSMRFRRLL